MLGGGYSSPTNSFMKKTIIFDLDGTIADLWPLERETLLKFYQRQDISMARKKLNQLYRSGIKDLFVLFQNISEINLNPVEFEKQYIKNQKQLQKENKLPNFKIFLQSNFLPKQINFALITGSPLPETLFVLKKAGCKKYFSKKFILPKGTYSGSKKTGEPFLMIKNQVGKVAIMIGDSDDDVVGARIGGYNCIRVNQYKEISKQKKELKNAIKKAELFLLKL